MVKPGQSVDIPILKAFAMWNLYAEWLGETDLMGLTPEPVLPVSYTHLKGVDAVLNTQFSLGKLEVTTKFQYTYQEAIDVTDPADTYYRDVYKRQGLRSTVCMRATL